MSSPKIFNRIEACVKDTGDTISSSGYGNQLKINRTDDGGSSVVIFQNNNEILGGIGVSRDRKPVFIKGDITNLIYNEQNKPTPADIGAAATSHTHSISNITNLQTLLDNRFNIGEAGASIPNGADLNSYTTIGNYYSTSSSVSTTLLNCPITGSGFRLVVMRGYNSSVPIQLILAYGNNVQYRAYESSSSRWSAWVNLTDHVASKLGTARKINSVSFDGTKDIYFNGSYKTNTDPASLPKGLSYIELPATATSTGDPTYGVCLTVSMSNVRSFQIGINNAGRMYTRSAHTNHTGTIVPGYSDWKQVWRSGDNVITPSGTDYSTIRARNTGAGTGSAPSSLANGEMWVKY